MRTACICFVILTFCAPAVAQVFVEPAPKADAPEVDIRDVSPEDLGGQDVREILGAANAAYQEKNYEAAARAYIRALRLSPGDSTALYNLACCYGLLGHVDQAAAFVTAAWKAGFRDLGHINNDVDFEKVRMTKVFSEAMVRLAEDAEKRKKVAGERLTVATRVMADVRVIPPTTQEPMKRYPLVVGLHGFGSNAEDFAKLFVGRDLDQPFYYCVAQAPYAMPFGPRLGWSWMLRGDRIQYPEAIRSHELSVGYVLDVLSAVKKRYPIDEQNVYLLGFSQGAGLAFSTGMRHPEKFRGVIPIGGWLDEGEHSPERIAEAAKKGLFLICHSPEDRVVPFGSAESAVDVFRRNEVPHCLVRYAGGHSIPASLLEKIVSWMAEPGPDNEIEVK